MRQNALANLGYALCVCCVASLIGYAYHERLVASQVGRIRSAPFRHVNDWRAYDSVGHRVGSAHAKVTIVEFADFECPFCAELVPALARVQSRHPRDVALVFRHFPLAAIHPFAMAAAVASECADDQGRYVPFHDLVFAHQDSIGTTKWSDFAKRAGVGDANEFSRCLSSKESTTRVLRDVGAGQQLGVHVTPTLLINSIETEGTLDSETLDSLVLAQIR